MDLNLPSNSWVSQLLKSEFAVLVLGFEKLWLGLDNCGRTTENAYCRVCSLCPCLTLRCAVRRREFFLRRGVTLTLSAELPLWGCRRQHDDARGLSPHTRLPRVYAVVISPNAAIDDQKATQIGSKKRSGAETTLTGQQCRHPCRRKLTRCSGLLGRQERNWEDSCGRRDPSGCFPTWRWGPGCRQRLRSTRTTTAYG